jgi:hypothetical protein
MELLNTKLKRIPLSHRYRATTVLAFVRPSVPAVKITLPFFGAIGAEQSFDSVEKVL